MDRILKTLNVLAAVATVGAFMLEVWRTWKEHKREDVVEEKK